MLVFEQDSTYPGSHFACSELCCHHRHGVHDCVYTHVCVCGSRKRVSGILELELGCKLPDVGSRN